MFLIASCVIRLVGESIDPSSPHTGELLKLAAELLREGLHTAEILEGYRTAYMKAQEILPTLVCHTVKNVRDSKELAFAIKTVIGSKQYGFEVRM